MPFLRLALLMLCALATLPARAQTPIRHCVGADGSPVFTDQPCASLQATPAPAASVAKAAPPLQRPAVTCAADRDDLRQAVIDAFASNDANRLAGLMLWAGYREHAAVADIRTLAALMQRPLLGIDVAAASSSEAPAGDGDSPQLIVRTVAAEGDGGADETRFTIQRHAGCLWLRQP